MNVSHLKIKNFRSIESTQNGLELGNLNILIGANNAGKSSVLKALSLMQVAHGSSADIRTGSIEYLIELHLENIPPYHPVRKDYMDESLMLIISQMQNSNLVHRLVFDKQLVPTDPFPSNEPDHLIIPFLSKRKAFSYQEDVRAQHAISITNDMQFLAAKLVRISNPGYPKHAQYKKTCEEVLGFLVTAVQSENGLRPGIYLPDGKTLTIDQMGEGVSNIAAFLIYLAESKGKLFLIEELENDLHPQALKALLELIILSSEENQFVISTHSNIVVRHLASVTNSKLYNIKTESNELPTKTQIELVPQTVEARMEVLSDLGYSFSDFDLWDGWLILEEASAERIIRDYLIPWFVPELTRIRTLSTKGADEVEPTFNDFNRLVRFTHLEEAYRNRGWVRVDGDAKGMGIVERLKSSYSNWEPDRFATFTHSQFEKYYPQVFTEDVEAALSLEGQKKREAKKLLLEKVRAWLDEDRPRAEAALEVSAKEIIADLKVISAQLKRNL